MNGTFTNVANVTCAENDTQVSDDATVSVDPYVALSIDKSVNQSTVIVGEEFTFTIVVTNNGLSDATDVVIVDTLPTGLTSEDTLTINVGDLAAGESKEFNITAVATVNGTFTNVASATCAENDTQVSDDAEVTARVVILDITKTASPSEILVGENVTFTITVTNKGDGNGTNLVISDVLNDTFKIIDYSNKDKASVDGQKITWSFEQIDAGQTVVVTVTVIVNEKGKFNNTAAAVCDQNKTVTNNTTNITVKPLTLTISVGNYTVYPGTVVPVEITVVDEKNNPVTINLTVVVTGPNATDSLPPHEGKLLFTITTDLGAAGDQVEITNGKGTYNYKVPGDATAGTSYIVTASTDGNKKYAAAEGTGYIDVIQVKTTTTISNASGAPGETVTLDVEVTAEDGNPVNGEVVVTCPDGTKVTVTIKDGKGQFDWTIPEDAKDGDEFTFTATFEGNSTYLASNGTGVVTVVEEPEPPEPPVPDEPEVVPAKMLNTGNPLVALLAAFVLIGLGLKRREEE